MRSTLLSIVAPVLCALAAVPAGTSGATTPQPRYSSRFVAITALRTDAYDVLLIARGPCGHKASDDCAAVFRSSDGGRTWTKAHRPPGSLRAATLTSVGPQSAWLTEHHYRGDSFTYVTTDDGATWRRIGLGNIESVVVVDGTVYAAKVHSLFAGTAEPGSLHWIGPSTGGQLAVAGETVYNYPTGDDRIRRAGPRLVAINGRTITAEPSPCHDIARTIAIAGDAEGGLVAICAGEPGFGQQLKWSFVSWDSGASWRRAGKPSTSGYTGSIAERGAAGTFVATGRSPLQVTYDGGQSWHFLHLRARDATDGEWQVGFDASGTYGWATDGISGSALLLSDDGGRTWRAAARPRLRR